MTRDDQPLLYVILSNGTTMYWPSGSANDNGNAIREEPTVPCVFSSDPALLSYGFRGPGLGYCYPPPPPRQAPAPPDHEHRACGFRETPSDLTSDHVLTDEDLLLRYGYTTSGGWGYNLSDPEKT